MYKIVFLDTYYNQVFADLPSNITYNQRKELLLQKKFGTSDFYSKAFKSHGWPADDLIVNDTIGQRLYMEESDFVYTDNIDTAIRQILDIQPDILYCQDLGFFSPQTIKYLRDMGVDYVVAQHSCPWAGDDRIKAYDLVFSSFPHYLERIKALGVKSEFLPIAFGGNSVLESIGVNSSHFRDIDVSFVGGVNSSGSNGNFEVSSGHWKRGTDIVEQISANFEKFQWWGYIIGSNSTPNLQRAYKGQAWGLDMYKIYNRSKIVINRHGEVAEGYSNNMRMFEATGCGALLMTEASKNIHEYFEPDKECVTYDNAVDLMEKIRYYLQHDEEREKISFAGHEHTMREHTYDKRLEIVRRALVNL